jgi:hypothetical protein
MKWLRSTWEQELQVDLGTVSQVVKIGHGEILWRPATMCAQGAACVHINTSTHESGTHIGSSYQQG